MKLNEVVHKVSTISHNADVRFILDTISWGALLGSMVNLLPQIATGLTVIWMSMRIGETLYGWFKNKKTNTDITKD